MKKSVFYTMLLTTLIMAHAQEPFICADEILQESQIEYENNSMAINWSGSIDPEVLASFEPVVFNVVFWKITDSNGEVPSPFLDIQEEDVLSSIASMNIEYNPYNIFFKYKSFEEIISPTGLPLLVRTANDPPPGYSCIDTGIDSHGYGIIDRCEIGSFMSYAANNGYKDPNAFNVYIPYDTRQFAGVSYYNDTRFLIRANLLAEGAMVHEMGHSFYLRHTFEGYNTANCERVTRDPSDPLFNAITRGDDVVDTAAVPNFHQEYCYSNPLDPDCYLNPNFNGTIYVDPNNCSYIGDSKNFHDESFDIYPPDVQNYMAYTLAACRNQFTIGQGIRMRETIRDDTFGRFAAATTTISALYEPYKGEYEMFTGGVTNFEEGALFQPGFKYTFIACSGNFPQPTAYGYSFPFNPNITVSEFLPDEQDYSSIIHPNHSAIRINEVEIGLGMTNVQKCYDNWNSPPIIGGGIIGGSVTKFNDNMFNHNITVTQKDSIGINQEALVNDLPVGLYKIEKQYKNGATEQTIILKEN